MKNIFKKIGVLGLLGLIPWLAWADGPRALVAPYGGASNLVVAVNPTNAVIVLGARTNGFDRIALRITNIPGSTQTNWIEFGYTATSNSWPLLPGAIYEEKFPIMDERSVSILGSTNGSVSIQEKMEGTGP